MNRSQPVYFQHIGTNKIGGGYCDAYLQGRLDPNTCFDVLGYSDTDNDWYAGDYTNAAGTPINEDATLENDHKLMTLTITKSFRTLSLINFIQQSMIEFSQKNLMVTLLYF